MRKFHEEVIGLTLMARASNSAFFKIADGYNRHSQVLALFDRSANRDYRGTDEAASTVDHLAFEMLIWLPKRADCALGLAVTTAEHAWVHWRSLYVNDPECNQVELVCYDSTVR